MNQDKSNKKKIIHNDEKFSLGFANANFSKKNSVLALQMLIFQRKIQSWLCKC
jgi:hypothetical protein